MARTARQAAALGVTMAVAISGSNNLSLTQRLGQDELGIELDGKKLFDKETFGGNGRTCQTCHRKDTGTLTLADVQRIIDKSDPDDAFLTHDALDDDGVGTTRVQAHATIRMTIPLPPWLSLADDPPRRTSPSFAVFHRPGTHPRSIRFCSTTGALPRCRSRHGEPSTTITRTPSNRRSRSSTPSQNSSEPTRTSSPRLRSGSSPRPDHRLSYRRERRRPSGEDARFWSTRPSTLRRRGASAPSVMAVRC